MNAEMPATPDPSAAPEPAEPVSAPRKAGETEAHLHLKRAAYCWALDQGYRCAAMEVSLPNSSYRADVAAYRPTRRRVEEQDPVSLARRLVVREVLGTTALFECKQSRADFLKDSRAAKVILAELEKLAERREALERQLKIHYPRLQRGDSLFPEYQTADLEHLEHAPYKRVVKRMERLQNQLYGQTKFEKIRRQGIANLFYLVVRPGLVEPHEVPQGWGLLEVAAEEGRPPELVAQPVLQVSYDPQRLGLLQRITQAAMRPMNKECGYVHPASLERAKLVDPVEASGEVHAKSQSRKGRKDFDAEEEETLSQGPQS
jgi:hypothetical protein